jgi:cytoskeletal protein RodZ
MTLGEVLRAARQKRRISLEQASEDTKIRVKFLRALEAGHYSSLPGAVYTKGFLRSYGEYLGLEPDELVALYHEERGVPDTPQRLEPIRSIHRRRALVFTPAIVIPLAITAGVVLFLGYLYYQFVSFAVPPRLEIVDPSGDAIVQQATYTLRGRTVSEGKLSVTVLPGPERHTGISAESDGSFAVPIKLKPGANHVEVSVLDATGKANAATRTITLDAVVSVPLSPPLVLEMPKQGSSFTDSAVGVSGRVESDVALVVVNGTPVKPDSGGRFAISLMLTPGQHGVHVVARTTTGAEVEERRTVSVRYTKAVVMLRVAGGNAWIAAAVDGAQDSRLYSDGQVVTLVGKDVQVRSGNAGVTYVTFNGQDLGAMGQQGRVAEKRFTQP